MPKAITGGRTTAPTFTSSRDSPAIQWQYLAGPEPGKLGFKEQRLSSSITQNGVPLQPLNMIPRPFLDQPLDAGPQFIDGIDTSLYFTDSLGQEYLQVPEDFLLAAQDAGGLDLDFLPSPLDSVLSEALENASAASALEDYLPDGGFRYDDDFISSSMIQELSDDDLKEELKIDDDSSNFSETPIIQSSTISPYPLGRERPTQAQLLQHGVPQLQYTTQNQNPALYYASPPQMTMYFPSAYHHPFAGHAYPPAPPHLLSQPPMMSDHQKHGVGPHRTLSSSANHQMFPYPTSHNLNNGNGHNNLTSSAGGGSSSSSKYANALLAHAHLCCPTTGCDKMFSNTAALRAHVKSHALERTYQCDACDASFRRSHDLKRHFRSIHTVIKPFGCDTCGKRFARMDALKRHTSRQGSTCFCA
ncbi:Metallothionein expression activator [Thoreauomyces humboldtii]|nr:Metallothionein expression activator [Thoreauomyces humboldtii]